MAIEEVADFFDGVAVVGGEVEIIGGQLLPIEALLREVGKPLEDIGPGLADEAERRDAAVVVELNVELARIGHARRLLGPLDAGLFFLLLILIFVFVVAFLFLVGIILLFFGLRLRAAGLRHRLTVAGFHHGLRLLGRHRAALELNDFLGGGAL